MSTPFQEYRRGVPSGFDIEREGDAAVPTARCGAGFEHEWHAFRGEDGKRHACDGTPRP